MDYYAAYLFPTPSIVEGIARLFDIGDSLSEYNYSATPEIADFRAADADWKQVGHDIGQAISRFEQLHPNVKINVGTCAK